MDLVKFLDNGTNFKWYSKLYACETQLFEELTDDCGLTCEKAKSVVIATREKLGQPKERKFIHPCDKTEHTTHEWSEEIVAKDCYEEDVVEDVVEEEEVVEE